MGKLLTRIVIIINTLLSYFPYSTKQVNLNIQYVSAELGDCGIACVSMIITTFSLGELIQKYKRQPFYEDSVGWYHQGLVQILEDSNCLAKTQFALTIWQLRNFLTKEKPIIVSLKVPHPRYLSETEVYTWNDPKAECLGHLCLLIGFNSKGFYLHDPRNIKGYTQDVFVSYRKFAKIFTGNGILIS